MNQEELRAREALCIQEEAPWCTARCPVNVDVKAMLAEAGGGDFAAARVLLGKKVPFPGILSRICDEPCRSECRRAEAGGAIRVRDIEFALTAAESAPPLPVRSAATGKRVAVVGAGLSGMTAALELTRKGHAVTVFEAQNSVGGRLLTLSEDILPRPVLESELSAAQRLGAEIRLGVRVERGDVADFDAVYWGTGAETPMVIDPVTRAVGPAGAFAGGGAVRSAPSWIGSVSDGRRAALSIDRFLQQVSLDAGRQKEGAYATRLFTSIDGVPSEPPVEPSRGSGYSEAEAQAEARRCLKCECLECVKVCEYLRSYKAYPKRYVREVYNNLSIVMGMRKANEFIDSCSLCGLCERVCPTGLNMAEVVAEARRMMADAGKSPPSAFDFALRDLAFSTGPEFFLSRSDHERPAYVFFPGCQLAAVLPGQVENVYADLREHLAGGVALLLGCCGVPASWAGQETLAAQVAAGLAAEWERLGKPRILAGCPTCTKTLAARIPGAQVEHLAETLDRIGLPLDPGLAAGTMVAVQDACTARDDLSLHAAVRRIIGRAGWTVQELKTTGKTAECCGYGGLMYNANASLADAVSSRRAAQSPHGFVAYCAMCRERFQAQGKPTSHVLELFYGPAEGMTTFTRRRENRRLLRARLLSRFWGETSETAGDSMKVLLTDAVSRDMEARFILRDDVEAVIRHAEETGERMRQDGGPLIACHRPGTVTYWVWYEKTSEGFLVTKVYSHRMQILGARP